MSSKDRMSANLHKLIDRVPLAPNDDLLPRGDDGVSP